MELQKWKRSLTKYLDETFETSLSGASRDFAESSSNTSFAFILALVLIFLVLAAQFESFIDPFIIMITVPLALAGAVLKLMGIRTNAQYLFTDRYHHADWSCNQEWNFDR